MGHPLCFGWWQMMAPQGSSMSPNRFRATVFMLKVPFPYISR